jgi:hypothetical protein
MFIKCNFKTIMPVWEEWFYTNPDFPLPVGLSKPV